MLRFERKEIAQKLLCMWVALFVDLKASIGRWETFRYRRPLTRSAGMRSAEKQRSIYQLTP